ncbi:MAG TPA: phage portal protein [Phycisphaerae bacterium]|nr:phage portal protein [Phycisphaerae bacterium]
MRKPRLAGDSRPPIRAKYDSAQTTPHNAYHWASADSYDADSANSKAVRSTLVKRSRYETENNGDGKGINLTHANYVVGRGPILRMETGNKGFNDAIEAVWKRWAKRVRLARKLRTAVKARVRDGEAFLFIASNPTIPERVKLDVIGIECDQITTPMLPYQEPNRIDGIKFDEWGNPLWYDMLKYHPGGPWAMLLQDPEQVPAKFILHLFREDRPGQHRAVPEITSTLGNFAQNRRFREAVIAAAENIANFSVLVKTGASLDEGPDQLTTFSTLPVQKGMMVALPGGGDAFQPKAEQPAATYPEFTRSQLREEARPLNMPYNIAACDSSDYSFSGGRLDHLTYFVSVDVDQADIEDAVLDPLFEVWFAEAVLEYGWTDTGVTPAHSWAWPPRPQIDDQKTASARQMNLATGVETPSNIANENGYDYEDHVQRLANDYGVSIEEIKRALFQVNILSRPGASAPPQSPDSDDDKPAAKSNGTARANGRARLASANGNGRLVHA